MPKPIKSRRRRSLSWEEMERARQERRRAERQRPGRERLEDTLRLSRFATEFWAAGARRRRPR